ncbi:MAG: hypothetical protein ABI036_02110, partial [Fibrobacteria bacterium]
TQEEMRNVPEIAKHAGRTATLASLLPEKEGVNLSEYVREVLERSPFLFAGKDWDALCSKHGLSPDLMRQAMRQDLARDWGLEALLVETLERALETYSLRAVIVDEEHSPQAGALGAWARQRQIPVLHIHQGLGLAGNDPANQTMLSDVIAVAGPRDIEAWQDAGLAAGRMIQTGNPAWVKYTELAAMKADCRAGLARLIGWGSGPLIVFGTGYAPIQSPSTDPEVLAAAARAFFRCARESGKVHPASIWAVLLQAEDPEGLETALKAWAAEEGVPSGRLHFFRNDAELFLAAAELVVSVDSTLIVQALLAGTPALNVLTDSGWRVGPAFAADTGVQEVAPEDMREHVLKALERPAMDARALESARNAYQPANGDPIKNVVDWIASMLAPA